MSLRQIVYSHLVTNNEYIRDEYENNNIQYPEQHKKHRIKSWMWLVGLNIKYKLLKISPNFPKEKIVVQEKIVNKVVEKKTIVNSLDAYKMQGGVPFLYKWRGNAYVGSESQKVKVVESNNYNLRQPLCRIMYQFRDIQLASFDIFDTLLFRPFSDPKDIFYIVGSELNEPYFYTLRIRCEKEARDIKEKLYGTREIDIYDIYKRLNYYTNIDVEYGVNLEYETEKKFLYVNPYIKYIMDTFINKGVPVILVSDMYYPKQMMEGLLASNGICEYDNLYVSCDYECSKIDGYLFEEAINDYSWIVRDRIQHFDDNFSNIKKAREIGINGYHYASCNSLCKKYRPEYLSPLVGSAYKGIVANYLHYNETRYSVPYEFGFMYGGPLTLGYCEYIYAKCKEQGINKVLFVSRDGDVLKQVWDYLHSEIPSEYTLISRRCITMLAVENWKRLFIEGIVDRCSTKKVGLSIEEILEYFGLEELMNRLSDYGLEKDLVISSKDNNEIVNLFRDFIEANIDVCANVYKESNCLYKEYIANIINDCCGDVAIVDVGWRGTAGMMLKKVIEEIKPDLQTHSFLCGNRQPGNIIDIREKNINCYIFSAEENYDALFKHAENTNYFYELLLTSATPSFGYFYKDEVGKTRIKMGQNDFENNKKILEIQRGIKDFIKEYTYRFKNYKNMYNIPSSDVAQIVYSIMSQPDYVKQFFGDIIYTPEIGEAKNTLNEWI